MSIDWRAVTTATLLADGKVDEAECKALGKHFKSSEGTWLQEGVTFLRDLRNAYTKLDVSSRLELTRRASQLGI